ncbi:hypothetical protein LEP1GSC133_1739 [Leptospira borgpetersenii serovar Pomona str. 200901868]|uniref:Uncharacterized protein n=1 Tax=Leptospira borgpetersenii serovar Pomona str. 200901868 TaxID=1192866 RepID=M6WBR1_LEPBO|nr:hypothetical protein LEP1GSC133_1739 [Leptospira borgpetersenii serovar Pomona str. 200901868]
MARKFFKFYIGIFEKEITTRTYENNTMMSLFQKLECWIFFKRTDNSELDLSFENFYIFAKIVR